MRNNKVGFENLAEDEQQLANLKDSILQCKEDIARNTVNLGMYLYCAKEQVSHGEWEKWLADNVDFTKMTASRFMKVYKTTIDLDVKYDETIGNLNSSQLIEISKLKKTDVENLLDTENVKDMSVRELQKVIKDMKVKNKQPKKSNNVVTFETPTPPATITTEIVIQTDVNKIFTELCILNGELRHRTGIEEDLETTLVGKYYANEITHQEFLDVVAKNKLNLPIFFYKEALDEYLDRFDYYPEYQKYDSNIDVKADRTYYSLFDRDLEWQEAIRCWDLEDEGAIDWSKSNNVDNGTYQLAESYLDTTEYLCIYKDYKLKGTYRDGNMDDIKRLCKFDNDLDYSALSKLYTKLESQMKALNKRQTKRDEAERIARKFRQEQQKKYDEALENWTKNYQPYSMGKYKFEDLWDEKGDIKNYKLWREMCDFVSQQKRANYDKWKDYDFAGMFGGNNTPAIKEEDKPQYKRLFRILAKQCHPDIVKDDGTLMQLANKLKEQWGV